MEEIRVVRSYADPYQGQTICKGHESKSDFQQYQS